MEQDGQGESIESRILVIRRQRVMLDSDLAKLYGVDVKALNQAVKRNVDRFPVDFMFRLDWHEASSLRSQSVTLKKSAESRRGRHAKYLPHAFTEQGVAMLSSVLKGKRAVSVNVEIMRAFVRLRSMIRHDRELVRRIDALEAKYDRQFKVVFDAIRELMMPPAPNPKRRIGFVTQD
jgi:hypothetical protein